jgi:hypothetical protein
MYTYLKRGIAVLIILIVSGLFFSGSFLYSQDRVSLATNQRIIQKQVKVLSGPDRNAIYLSLAAGKPEIAELGTSTDQRKQHLKMYGFPNKLSPGNPMLPYKVYQVALPPDADPKSLTLEVINRRETQMRGEYTLVPCPPYNICQDDKKPRLPLTQEEKWGLGKKIIDGKNILVYQEDNYFPKYNASVNYTGQLRKWKIASVIFSPLRYNPVTGQLSLVSRMDVKLKFKRLAGYLAQPQNIKSLKDNAFEEKLSGTLLNYNKAKNWYVKPLLKPAPAPCGASIPDPDYAIFATEDIFDATNGCQSLDDFCAHKENLGFEVMVITEHQARSVDGNRVSGYSFNTIAGLDGYEDVTGAPAPGQRPEKIRKWLQDNYAALGIKYVLLLGNPDPDNHDDADAVGNLPMKLAQLHMGADVPTDFYFAELSSGNWDLDGDGLAGEYYTSAGYTNGIPGAVTDKTSFSARVEGELEVSITATSSTLSSAISAGTDTVTVADATGFDFYQIVRVGASGSSDAEELIVRSVTGNDIRFMTNLANDHPAGTSVTLIGAKINLSSRRDGHTQVYLDQNNNGIDAGDLVVDDNVEHHPFNTEYLYYDLKAGSYPLRVDYSQRSGDAYCSLYYYSYSDNVELTLKHDDGGGIMVEGQDASFYNSTDFTGAAIDYSSPSTSIYILHVTGGDKGPGGMEFLPELLVGRIPCYDEDSSGLIDYDKMSLILDKIIAYENAVLADNPWRRHVLTSAPFVVDNPTHPDDPTNAVRELNTSKYEWSELLRSFTASPPLWNWHRIYMEDYGLTPDPETIPCSNAATVDAWDDGKGVVMWMTHGSQTSAEHVISNTEISSLDDAKPSIVFMGACSNGKPEYYATWGIPLGYVNLKQGAIATVSATRTSYG